MNQFSNMNRSTVKESMFDFFFFQLVWLQSQSQSKKKKKKALYFCYTAVFRRKMLVTVTQLKTSHVSSFLLSVG